MTKLSIEVLEKSFTADSNSNRPMKLFIRMTDLFRLTIYFIVEF